MTVLTQGDVEAILAFVGEAASTAEQAPFSLEALLGALRDLAGADQIVFSELDRIRQRHLNELEPDGELPRPPVTYWEIRRDHPVCAYQARTSDYRARRVSDFMSHRQLIASRVYREWFKPQGYETEMCAGLDAPLWHTKVFLFRRLAGDFSERDRAVVEAVRPMLARLYEANLSRQRVARVLELVAGQGADQAAALVILDSAGRPDFVSEAAQALFERMGAVRAVYRRRSRRD